MENRSTFVTVVAWVFILASGLASVIASLQVAAFSVYPPVEEAGSLAADTTEFLQVMNEYASFFVYGFAIVFLMTFISSIGLLMRKNWARKVFVAVLFFGILWQVFGISMQHIMFSEMETYTQHDGADELAVIQNIIKTITYIFAAALALTFAWIIKKLVTRPIVDEFIQNESSH